jgi:hypothetical protein
MSQNETQRLNLLREIEEIQSRMVEQNRAAATATGQELQMLRDRIAAERQNLQLRQSQLETLEDTLEAEKEAARQAEARNARQKAYNDLQDDFVTSFTKMSSTHQKFLTDSNTSGNAFANITAKILELKQQEVDASDDDRAILQQRRATLEAIRTEQIEAAAATAKSKEDLFGISEAEKRRSEFQQSIATLTQEEQDLAQAAFDAKENLILQQERYNQLQNAGQDILGKMPAGVQSVIGGIKSMVTGIRAFGIQAAMATAGLTLVIGAIIAGLDYFMEMDKAAEDFRNETGVTNSMMGDMNEKAASIGQQFGTYGVSMADAYGTMAALREEMGEIANYSEAAVAGITLMKTNFGISAEEASKVQGVLENVGGLSQDTAVNVQMQVANMAKLAGVAPKKVFKDIADNAEAASTFFKGDLNALAKNAVEARRLGTNLSEVTKTAEKLLDFEGSIEEELVAATFVGGQFNLGKARELAIQGKLVEAQEETLKQIQRSGDFRKQDYHTQLQLAKASGMSVEEINKQLNTQEKLASLTEEERAKAEKAIEAGLDITNLNDEQLAQEVEKAAAQQEMAGTISQMENTFKGILATVGGALLPLFEILGPILKNAFFPLKVAAKLIQVIIDGITWVVKKIPFLGAAIEKVGSLAGEADSFVTNFSVEKLASGAYSGDDMSSAVDIGDLNSPAGGRTMVSTKEGGLFRLSPNDDLLAAPGISNAFEGPQKIINGLLDTLTFGLLGSNDNESSLGTSNVDFTVLSAPLNTMINEIKGLRADMASGKIAVYMDTAKVTSNIGRQVDQSTRNNYSLGQA